nr:unnamed protein product [Digitaria exilis]
MPSSHRARRTRGCRPSWHRLVRLPRRGLLCLRLAQLFDRRLFINPAAVLRPPVRGSIIQCWHCVLLLLLSTRSLGLNPPVCLSSSGVICRLLLSSVCCLCTLPAAHMLSQW